ncbi:MAG: flavin reductase family protein [Clostridia bacterium]|nr:flavin reductase family protein [Clostridia bacterium]
MKEYLQPSTILAPIPAVMVSCGNMEQANITTIAWTGVLNSEPPLVYVSIRPARYSYHIIKETKEFVINLPDEALVWHTDFCGTKSGKEIDKFREAKLTKEPCKQIKAPGIKECPINLECKLKEIKPLGSHDMFIGEIVNVNAKSDLIENGKINIAKANLITYLGNQYYVANKKIAERGICLK